MPRVKVDAVVHGAYVVPVAPSRVVLKNTSVVIDQGMIVALLPRTSAELARYEPAEETDCLTKPHILMPGLVNAHAHSAMTLLRGLTPDSPLDEWLNEHVWPTESRFVSEAFCRDGTELAVAEMLRGGTTTVNEMYFYPHVAAQVAIDTGMRALVGLLVLDVPTPWAAGTEDCIRAGLAVQTQLAEWQRSVAHLPHERARVNLAWAPHAPYTVCDDTLRRIKALADAESMRIHMHVHETADELVQSRARYGVSPLQRLDTLGLLNERFIAVHMTQLSDADVALCARRGVHVVHCPESNMKLASGFARVHDLLMAGVPVGIGTDGCASNNDLDMFGELRSAAMLAKAVSGSAAALAAHEALELATIRGAHALGMGAQTGSLEVGKCADLISVDVSGVEATPMHSAINHLVYSASRADVRDVWVNGARLMADRQLLTLHADKTVTRALRWEDDIAAWRASQKAPAAPPTPPPPPPPAK